VISMTEVLRVLKNIIYLLMREVVSKLSVVILMILIGRYLGSQGLGDFSFSIFFCQLAFLISDLGLSTLLVRDVAKDRRLTGKYVENLSFVRFILGMAISIAIYMLAVFAGIGSSGGVRYILILCSMSFFAMTVTDIFTSAFRAHERMNYELVVNIPKNIIFLLFGVLAVLKIGDLESIFFIFLISNLVALVLAYVIYKLRIPKAPGQFDFSFCKSAIRQAMPFFLAILCVTIYFRIDSVMLFFMRSSKEVGFYNASYIAIDGYLMASGVVGAALFPFFSRVYERSAESLQKAYAKSLKAVFFIFFPVTVLIFSFANPIMSAVYGAEFMPSASAMQILIWAAMLVAMGNLNCHLAYSINRQNVVLLTAFLGVIINVVLNLLLIPSFGFLGASVATVITEFSLFMILFLYINLSFYHVPVREVFIKTALSAVPMIIAILALKDINGLLAAAVSLAAFVMTNYFVKGLLHEERENIRKLKLALKGQTFK